MAWRIGRLTCGAPSVFCWLNLVSISLWGQPSEPGNVPDCRPCSFSPGGQFPVYQFTFVLNQDRIVTAIEVTQDSQFIQRLPVTGMEPTGAKEDFFFGGVDINFDGLLDLMLIVRRGVANAYAAYWLFDPQQGKFTALGTYPVFRVDAGKRQLSTYERGGSAGLIHDSKEYAFVDGKLTVMREEKQEATRQAGVFRNVVRQRVNGVMKVLKTEMVKAPR